MTLTREYLFGELGVIFLSNVTGRHICYPDKCLISSKYTPPAQNPLLTNFSRGLGYLKGHNNLYLRYLRYQGYTLTMEAWWPLAGSCTTTTTSTKNVWILWSLGRNYEHDKTDKYKTIDSTRAFYIVSSDSHCLGTITAAKTFGWWESNRDPIAP